MTQTGSERSIQVPVAGVSLDGSLGVPRAARGIVLFAHGSGSSRHSPRNQFVALVLRRAQLATLLIDLLTKDEEAEDLRTRRLRFDIDTLAGRLVRVAGWLEENPDTSALRLGFFGASTGAGAALVAAAERPELVDAVVSRGGRPDLAGKALASVEAPTLLIVGGRDTSVIGMNESALAQLRGDKELVIVPGATHLFEEPGALEEVARRACDWFGRYLGTAGSATR